MATRPRLSIGTLDLGDVKASVETVVEENVALYDRAYRTVIDNFTEPLSAEEQRRAVENLTAAALAQLVIVDPELARTLLAAARRAGA